MGEKFTVRAEKERTENVPKKSSSSKFCLGCLGMILAIIVLLALGVFYLFSNLRKPIDLGVKATPADFNRFVKKAGLTLGSDANKLCFTCSVKYSGKKEADFNLTNQEASAWFNAFNSEIGLISGTQIKIEPDKVLIVTNFSYQGQTFPVFASGKITKTGPQSVKIDMDQAKLGKLPIPGNFIPPIEEALNQLTNQRLAEMDNFQIEELELREGYLHFKGSLPEKVSAI